MGTGASFGNPKSKLQLAAIFATRDQFAKYILIRHRVSYNIYVDEGNLGKAIAHAINKNKIVSIKIERIEDKPKSHETSAEEINRKLAEAQKASWKSDRKIKIEEIIDENNKKKDENSDKKSQDEEILRGTVVEDEKFNPKVLAGVAFPVFLVALRSPLGKRFLAPLVTALSLPVGFLLFYLIENNRARIDEEAKGYNTKSVMELREERMRKSQ